MPLLFPFTAVAIFSLHSIIRYTLSLSCPAVETAITPGPIPSFFNDSNTLLIIINHPLLMFQISVKIKGPSSVTATVFS